MADDGTNKALLCKHEESGRLPVWSPDGTRLVNLVGVGEPLRGPGQRVDAGQKPKRFLY